jgi:hypothetical protein
MDIEEVTLKSGNKFFVKERNFKFLWFKERSIGEVHPLKKDLTKPFGKGNINWNHFFFGGSFLHFLSVTCSYYLIIYFLLFAYWNDTHAMKIVYEHPACFYEPHLKEINMNSTECVRMEKLGNYTSNIDFENLKIPK